MDTKLAHALREGVVDALGFVCGALAGGLVARLAGFDFMADAATGTEVLVGCLLVGLGAGSVRNLARRLLLPVKK